MEHLVRMGLLLDFYGGLLTTKQQRVFSLYYMDNLSLAEIADQEGTTRQAVHDLLQRTERILEGWEEQLLLLDRFLRGQELYKTLCKSFSNLTEVMSDSIRGTHQYIEFKQALRALENFLNF